LLKNRGFRLCGGGCSLLRTILPRNREINRSDRTIDIGSTVNRRNREKQGILGQPHAKLHLREKAAHRPEGCGRHRRLLGKTAAEKDRRSGDLNMYKTLAPGTSARTKGSNPRTLS
jgi:hypothetical protein